MTRIRVGVVGAGGRMGREVCRAVSAAEDLDLVAEVGGGEGPEAVASRLVEAGASVAVDFTRPDVVLPTVAALVSAGVHAVVGTSGFDAGRLATVRGWVDDAPGVGVVVAPNFAIGAVLLMRFAAMAAPHMESVEIVELHHPDKVDAPSGTAIRTAEMVGEARAAAGLGRMPDAGAGEGARGVVVDGVRVHSVRLRGLVAHQEVLLGGPGEVLTVRHDSLDRSAFMPGVLLAVREVGRRPGLTVGLEPLLDLY